MSCRQSDARLRHRKRIRAQRIAALAICSCQLNRFPISRKADKPPIPTPIKINVTTPGLLGVGVATGESETAAPSVLVGLISMGAVGEEVNVDAAWELVGVGGIIVVGGCFVGSRIVGVGIGATIVEDDDEGIEIESFDVEVVEVEEKLAVIEMLELVKLVELVDLVGVVDAASAVNGAVVDVLFTEVKVVVRVVVGVNEVDVGVSGLWLAVF